MSTSIGSWTQGTLAGLPRSFWFLTLGTFVNRAGLFVLPFLSLYLTTQRGLSVERATEVVSLYGIGSFISQFLGGFLADRLGRRTTMLISLFVTAALLLLLGTLSDIGAISVITLLIGLFTDLYRPASSAVIADVVLPADRARAFSLRYWAINLGAAVGLALGGLLAQSSFGLLFIGDALTTLGFGLIILLFVPETHGQSQRRAARTLESTQTVEVNAALALADQRRRLVFTLLFMVFLLCSGSVYFQSGVTMPIDMAAKGLSAADYGGAVALNGLLIVLVSIPINRLFEHRSPFRMLAFSVLLIGLGFGVYAFATGLPLYVLGVVIWTLGELIGAPIGPTVMAEVAPKGQTGLYQGLFGAGWGLAAFTGPILGGFIYGHWGSAALWIGCLALNTIVAFGYIILLAPRHRRLTAFGAPVQLQT